MFVRLDKICTSLWNKSPEKEMYFFYYFFLQGTLPDGERVKNCWYLRTSENINITKWIGPIKMNMSRKVPTLIPMNGKVRFYTSSEILELQ
jgi:hypothetical protein